MVDGRDFEVVRLLKNRGHRSMAAVKMEAEK